MKRKFIIISFGFVFLIGMILRDSVTTSGIDVFYQNPKSYLNPTESQHNIQKNNEVTKHAKFDIGVESLKNLKVVKRYFYNNEQSSEDEKEETHDQKQTVANSQALKPLINDNLYQLRPPVNMLFKGKIQKTQQQEDLAKNKIVKNFLGSEEIRELIADEELAQATPYTDWCTTVQKHNCSFTPYVDKHRIKQLLPDIAPGLRFAEEFAAVSFPEDITEELVDKLPHSYFMKVNNDVMSLGMINVQGNEINCMQSTYCQKIKSQCGAPTVSCLRMLCGYFLQNRRQRMDRQKINCLSLVEPMCIFEEPFKPVNKSCVTDYKVFVFQGQPMFMSVISDRCTTLMWNYRTTTWKEVDMDIVSGLLTSGRLPLPAAPPPYLPALVRYARLIGRLFSHIRVDFFVSGDEFWFAEVQQTSSGCDFDFRPHVVNRLFGFLIRNPGVVVPSDYLLYLTGQIVG